MISEFNPYKYIRRHTHTTLQHVSPNIKTNRVCYIHSAVRELKVPLFGRPFRLRQSCHGDENGLLFSSLFVKIKFVSKLARFNYSLKILR